MKFDVQVPFFAREAISMAMEAVRTFGCGVGSPMAIQVKDVKEVPGALRFRVHFGNGLMAGGEMTSFESHYGTHWEFTKLHAHKVDILNTHRREWTIEADDKASVGHLSRHEFKDTWLDNVTQEVCEPPEDRTVVELPSYPGDEEV